MRNAVQPILAREGITEWAILPISAVRVLRPELFLRAGDFSPKSLLIFLVPYYVGPTENLSLYAAARDYHRYMRDLSARLGEAIGRAYPEAATRGFSDHSPIDERYAAATAGLGMLGDNGLLINPTYGSFVFIGALFSDLEPDGEAQGSVHSIVSCEHCGACLRACPTGALAGEGDCLSELTQRRGELAPEAALLMRKHHTVWGCDLCQTACPHNRRVMDAGRVTPIGYFHEDRITHLDSEMLAAMPRSEFESRAFAWRGRQTLARNLAAYEGGQD